MATIIISIMELEVAQKVLKFVICNCQNLFLLIISSKQDCKNCMAILQEMNL